MDSPPKLIVTSRLADERLWSEVLNLGGFDVLAQPFNPREALRCIGEACHHWQEEYSKDQLEEAAGHMTA
jgi:DNA-binding response OmpR family regulator